MTATTSTGPRLAIVILAVDDVPGMAQFYRRALGMDPIVDLPMFVQFRLPGGADLGLYEREAFGQNTGRVPAALPGGALRPFEIYLMPPDLEAAAARLQEAGARELSPLAVRLWGDEVSYHADPEGNVIALARPIED